MEILKNYVLLFLFLYLTNALRTKKQNQMTPLVESRNISEIDHFIEDDSQIKSSFNKDNKNEKLKIENSTLKVDLRKNLNRSKITPKTSPENDVMKAIHLPIDLLLKHPPINSSKNSNIDANSSRISTSSTIEPVVTYFKPNIDFSDEKINVVDESIADFYNTIKSNKPKEIIRKPEDLKVVDDYVNINMTPESLEEPEINSRNDIPKPDNNYFKINFSPNSTETLRQKINTPDTTIEILIKLDPSVSNPVSQPNSSVVFHNSNYQEITQPTWPINPILPHHLPYRSYIPYSYIPNARPYCVSGQCYPCKFHSPQYPGYSRSPNAVWKTWNNMDISMINPKDVKFNYDGISDGSDLNRMSEYVYDDNLNEIQDEDIF